MWPGQSAGILHLHLDQPVKICPRCVSSNFYFYYHCTSFEGDALEAENLSRTFKKSSV